MCLSYSLSVAVKRTSIDAHVTVLYRRLAELSASRTTESFMLPTTYGIINSRRFCVSRRSTRWFYDDGAQTRALRVNRLTSADLFSRRLFDSPIRRASLIEKRRSQPNHRRRI